MKKYKKLGTLALLALLMHDAVAQCSICTKTAQQLGEEPAGALNNGIIYLMLTPLAIMAYIGITWWRKEKEVLKSEGL
ncbi:MAG: hypothetical protein EAZ47_06875 [Bacteroidetes bacterium]|jgi:hypothetical protein|nr:MAG: hypothetical protein EAY72_01115 [Bacteroidota bacterium]TAE70979.1 MAG: hypothetical protein EAY68_02360 [Bacteroidota bacterium]TAF93322.1 MAG: hypothetical protein EAZ47_06875 [Bacteroidota bacterium]